MHESGEPSGLGGALEDGRVQTPQRHRRQVLRTVALALALSGIGCARRHQVWFTPNLGSPDMLDLFSKPEEWELARSQVDVFKFYSQQLLTSGCPPCGGNVLSSLTRVQAIPKLKAWGVVVAAEVPVVKPGACDGAAAAAGAQELLDNVEALGGSVGYLAMDEPLASGAACGYAPTDTAREASAFMERILRDHPGVVVGDIEPYPLLSATDISDWLSSLKANGTPPGFFHLDVDHRLTEAERLDVGPDMRAIQGACLSQSLSFGVLLSGKDGVDDSGYYSDVVAWTETVKSAVGEPDHVIVQSFSESSGGLFVVPTNLPESDATLPTHARLLNQTVQALKSQ